MRVIRASVVNVSTCQRAKSVRTSHLYVSTCQRANKRANVLTCQRRYFLLKYLFFIYITLCAVKGLFRKACIMHTVNLVRKAYII